MQIIYLEIRSKYMNFDDTYTYVSDKSIPEPVDFFTRSDLVEYLAEYGYSEKSKTEFQRTKPDGTKGSIYVRYDRANKLWKMF